MLLLSPLLLAAVTVPNVDLPLTSPFEEQQQNAPVEQTPSIQDFQLQEIKSEDLDLEWLPAIQGPTPYSKEQLKQILSSCKRKADACCFWGALNRFKVCRKLDNLVSNRGSQSKFEQVK